MIVFRNALRFSRLLRFGLHLVYGLSLAALRFGKLDQAERVIYIQRWSNQLTRILGIQVRVQGVAPGTYPPNHLLLSNHISWLDIFVLNAVTVSRFVAKSEIEQWPLVGRLCGYTGTLFIQREKKRDAARVNNAMVEALQARHCLAVFPEGTTSDGSNILPFRSSLLQAALESRATIQPVYLRYTDASGKLTHSPAYINDISIVKSLWQILGEREMRAEINFLAPFPAQDVDRRSLTQMVEARIVAAHKALNHGEGDFDSLCMPHAAGTCGVRDTAGCPQHHIAA
ncbi:lysophospholipid acyltransferase family protein [Amantichitinum ursilacus]|uniref:1-acyl-sn-glycerol-3-phosphate acyltransferase n=1 Tax=Amantichitinum ursilacus TaxID=857265 RepID=A0A0N0XHM7_9NEIS|nr:lysophospholipid acyltransferase family protein [Amantichitinum ursilacus]KPC49232.1 1-acyl-sn-glycerol-3-phosphate acyltransferase [Amantichitinum ursilacus]